MPWLGRLLEVPRIVLLPGILPRDVRVGVSVVARLQPVAPRGQVLQAERPIGGRQCLAPEDRGVEGDDPDLARHGGRHILHATLDRAAIGNDDIDRHGAVLARDRDRADDRRRAGRLLIAEEPGAKSRAVLEVLQGERPVGSHRRSHKFVAHRQRAAPQDRGVHPVHLLPALSPAADAPAADSLAAAGHHAGHEGRLFLRLLASHPSELDDDA